MRFGFAKELRLLQGADFQRVFGDKPCQFRANGIMLFATPNQLGRPRLGLIVGRKACARSVGRNRIKRLTRESFRLHQALLGSNDIIALARRGQQRPATAKLRQKLDEAWPQLAQKLSTRRNAKEPGTQ